MEIKEIKNLVVHLDNFSAQEVNDLALMDENELYQWQYEIEKDSGNTSNWDDIRGILTLKHKIMELKQMLS